MAHVFRTIGFFAIESLLPMHQFHGFVNRYRGNYHMKTLSCLDQLFCMAFTQLSYRESLRSKAAGDMNNDGIVGSGSLESAPEEIFDRIVAVNLKAWEVASKLAVPEMNNSSDECIIFTSSTLGIRPFPQGVIYSITKTALIMLTKALAVHMSKHGIGVNSICSRQVGFMALFQQMAAEGFGSPEIARHIISKRPAPRPAVVEEIPEAALVLTSPEPGYITGLPCRWTAEGWPRSVTLIYKIGTSVHQGSGRCPGAGCRISLYYFRCYCDLY